MSAELEVALELAREAARRCGLDAAGAQLLRARASILIELPAAGAIVRIEALARAFVAERMVASARAFARSGSPTMRMIAPERQPLRFAAGIATVWERIEGEQAGRLDYEVIGALTRELHDSSRALADAGAQVPELDPFAGALLWLAKLDAEGYDPVERAALEQRCAELRARWQAQVRDPGELGLVLLHGDVHHENVILGPEGPRFVDLELGGRGPACWDFATLAAAVELYGTPPAMLDAFVRGYGFDPRGSAQLAFFREVYAFTCALWALDSRARSPELAAEAELRVASVLGPAGATGPRWTLL